MDLIYKLQGLQVFSTAHNKTVGFQMNLLGANTRKLTFVTK